MSYFFLLPTGLWLFQVGAVVLTRVLQHRWTLGNPGHGIATSTTIEHFGKFMRYDAAKLGVESWMVTVAIILIAAIDEHSVLRTTPPEVGDSVILGTLLLGVFSVIIFAITLALWVYLEGHQGSLWWSRQARVGGMDRMKWLAGISANVILGTGGLVLAAYLA